jgi:hypothetical protein
VVASGLVAGAPALQYADDGYRPIAVEQIETAADPQFDTDACGGFRPGDETAQAYGAYAP